MDKGPQFGDFLAQHGFTPEEQKKSSGLAEFLQKNADMVRSKFAKKWKNTAMLTMKLSIMNKWVLIWSIGMTIFTAESA
jgi:hypothetical protein